MIVLAILSIFLHSSIQIITRVENRHKAKVCDQQLPIHMLCERCFYFHKQFSRDINTTSHECGDIGRGDIGDFFVGGGDNWDKIALSLK
jgi:hypothetical protein